MLYFDWYFYTLYILVKHIGMTNIKSYNSDTYSSFDGSAEMNRHLQFYQGPSLCNQVVTIALTNTDFSGRHYSASSL
jgi:hypothetical protein